MPESEKLKCLDLESLYYLYTVQDLFETSLKNVQKDNCEFNRLNSIIWLMSCYEVLSDIHTIFPKLISKSSNIGDTFAENDLEFILNHSQTKIIRSTELKLIRDKCFHGKQENFKNKKDYNSKSWELLKLCLKGEEHFLKLLDNQSNEMLVFLNFLKADINQYLGFDLRKKLREI